MLKKNKTQIANSALRHIGSGSEITDFETDTSHAGKTIRLFYDDCRQFILEQDNWGFARRKVQLPVLYQPDMVGTEPFIYQYPSDCVVARVLQPKLAHEYSAKFEIINHNDTTAIETLVDKAELQYTADIENTQVFSNSFTQSLEYYLAFKIGESVTDNLMLIEKAGATYQQLLNNAKTLNSNERQDGDEPNAVWHRGYGYQGGYRGGEVG